MNVGFIKYLEPKHFLLILVPFSFLGILFFFRENIESILFKQLNELLKGYSEYRIVSPSFVLQNYKEVKIDKEFVFSLVKPSETITEIAVEEIDKKSIPLTLSFIYIGRDKYVIINGNLYREGDVSLEGFKIVRIEKERVKVTRGSEEKWLYIY